MSGVVYRPSEHPHQCTTARRDLELGLVYGCTCGRRYVCTALPDVKAGAEARWERTQVVRGWCDSHPGSLFLILVALMLAVAVVLTLAGVIT